MPGGAEGWGSGVACIGGGAWGQWRGLEGSQEWSVVYGGSSTWGLLAWALEGVRPWVPPPKKSCVEGNSCMKPDPPFQPHVDTLSCSG